jgi:adenylate kinase family enzyme
VALGHVLRLGGPPCSGKTSIARILAGRYDLRAYHADAHTWEHHDKAVERRYPAAARTESLGPDELWLAALDALVAHSLEANEERCRLMLEDIEALPPSPLIVAEGTPLFPWLIAERLASRDHAVWLVPTPEFQRARLEERPGTEWRRTSDPPRALANRIERERAVGERIERDARKRGLRVLTVDGSRDVAAMAAAVEEIFAEVAAGPRASDPQARSAPRREDKLQVYRQVSTFFERRPEAGDPARSPVPFACECGASGCDAGVRVTLVEAQRVFDGKDEQLAAPGHSR